MNKKGRMLGTVLAGMMLFGAGAQAEKARGVESPADSQAHSSHLQQHIDGDDLYCTGNYVKVRSKANGTQTKGHLERADTFRLLDVSGGYAQIEVLHAASTSPDSWAGLSGWVSADYVDCACADNMSTGSRFLLHMDSYEQVLEGYCQALTEGANWEDIVEAGFEPCEFVGSLDMDGYMLRDLNSDGAEELIILPRLGSSEQDGEERLTIIAVYAMVNNKPVRILESWTRSRNWLCKDGGILNEGSDGAAYWTCCIKDWTGNEWVIRDGVQTDLIWVDNEPVDVWRRMTQEERMYDGEIISEDEAQECLRRFDQLLLTEDTGFVSFSEFLHNQ